MNSEQLNPTTSAIDNQATNIASSSRLNLSTNNEAEKNDENPFSSFATIKSTNPQPDPANKISQSNKSTIVDTNSNLKSEAKSRQQAITIGRFFSICLVGSIEQGWFNDINDVYVKYSIVAGPDWILSSGLDVGITQIARYRLDESGGRNFVWNQPITLSYRSYNFFGWPQIVVSVYRFDLFGNEQILGYGCTHLPVSNQNPSNIKQLIKIYSPQSSSYLRQVLSWITGRKPELVDSKLFARGDCRSLLQMVAVGQLEISFNLTSKDVLLNNYRS